MSELSSRGNIIRKKRKIITEKKRRKKINHHLSELKTVLLEIMSAQTNAQTMKLEHSEVLEMAVDYFKSANRRLAPFGSNGMNANTGNSSYNSGYATCAMEVSNFLSLANVNANVKENVESFLSSKVTTCASSHSSSCRTPKNKPYDRTNTCMGSSSNKPRASAFNLYVPRTQLNTSPDKRTPLGSMQQMNFNPNSFCVPSVNDPPFYDIVSSMFKGNPGR